MGVIRAGFTGGFLGIVISIANLFVDSSILEKLSAVGLYFAGFFGEVCTVDCSLSENFMTIIATILGNCAAYFVIGVLISLAISVMKMWLRPNKIQVQPPQIQPLQQAQQTQPQVQIVQTQPQVQSVSPQTTEAKLEDPIESNVESDEDETEESDEEEKESEDVDSDENEKMTEEIKDKKQKKVVKQKKAKKSKPSVKKNNRPKSKARVSRSR